MELDSAKAVSPEGEGRPSCSWAGLASCFEGRGQQGTGDPRLVLATAESCQFQPAKGQTVLREGWGGAAALRRWRKGSVAHSDGACWQVSVEIQMDILALALSAMTSTSSKMAAGRSAKLWPQGASLMRNSSHKCSVLWLAGPPLGGHRPDIAGSPQAGQARVQSHTQTSGLPFNQCYNGNIG